MRLSEDNCIKPILRDRIFVHCRFTDRNRWFVIFLVNLIFHFVKGRFRIGKDLREYEGECLAKRYRDRFEDREGYQEPSRFCQHRFVHKRKCSSCSPELRSEYIKCLIDALLTKHAIKFLLCGVLMCDGVEHEDFFFLVGWDDKFILVSLGKIDTFWVFWFNVLGFKTNYYFDLFLSVYTTISTHPFFLFKIIKTHNHEGNTYWFFDDCFLKINNFIF